MPNSFCVDYWQNCGDVSEKKTCRKIISCDCWADVVQALHPLQEKAQYLMANRGPPLGWISPFFSEAFLLLWDYCYSFFSFFHSSPPVHCRNKSITLFYNCGNQYHHVIKQFVLNKANLCQDKSKQNYNSEGWSNRSRWTLNIWIRTAFRPRWWWMFCSLNWLQCIKILLSVLSNICCLIEWQTTRQNRFSDVRGPWHAFKMLSKINMWQK